MKKTFVRTFVTLTLALSLVFTGAVTTSVAEDDNYGIMLLHDGPTHDMIVK